MRGTLERPFLAAAAAAVGAALLVAAAVWLVNSAGGSGRAEPTGTRVSPSASAEPAQAAIGLVANPVTAPDPDDAQQELIDAGGTYYVSLRGGFSLVAPTAWHAGTFGASADRELRDLADSAGWPSIEGAVEGLERGETDFVGYDMPPDAAPESVVTAVNVWRWSRYGGGPLDQLADLLLEREGMPDATREPVDLPAGEAIRMRWSASGEDADKVAVSYVLITQHWAYGLELRTSQARADEAVDRFDEIARSFRTIPQPRRDMSHVSTGGSPLAIVIDASATVEPELLRAQQAAVIAYLEGLSPSVEVAIVAGGEEPRVVVPFGRWQVGRLDEVARAVAAIEPAGDRDMGSGLQLAAELVDETGFGGHLLVFAAGPGGEPDDELRTLIGERFMDVVAVAIGIGPHEAALHELSRDAFGTYLHVATAVELMTLTPALLANDLAGSSLIATGSIEPGDVPAEPEVIVGPEASVVRFEAGSAEGAVDLVVVDPDGRELSAESEPAEAAVVEGHRRTWITVSAPEPGTYRVRIDSESPASWSAVEEGPALLMLVVQGPEESPVVPIGWPVQLAVGLSLGELLPDDPTTAGPWAATGSVTMARPDGSTIRAPLDHVGSSAHGMSTDMVLTPELLGGTGLPGSYDLAIETRLIGPDGEVVHRSARRSIYYHPSPDRDGDGFPDASAEVWGIGADGSGGAAGDLDNDGLSLAEEALVHGTNPYVWDTDGGGEPDGSELDSGRDPNAPDDDVPEASCVPEDAERFEVADGEPPEAPDLERMLPDEIGGRSTEKGSIGRLPREFGFFNFYFDALLACADGRPDDMGVAFASVPNADGYIVFAIRVDGTTGAELEEIHISEAILGGRGTVSVEDASIAGREYRLLSRGGATASAGEVFYWMVHLSALDSGLYVDPEVLDRSLVKDTVRQLPAP